MNWNELKDKGFWQIKDLIDPNCPISKFVERFNLIKEHHGEEAVQSFLKEFFEAYYKANNI